MTEPDPVLVRRISGAITEAWVTETRDPRNGQPYVGDLARSVAASLGGSVTTEWRVLCADGGEHATQDGWPHENEKDARIYADLIGGDCGPHRVESRQVWHSEWTAE